MWSRVRSFAICSQRLTADTPAAAVKMPVTEGQNKGRTAAVPRLNNRPATLMRTAAPYSSKARWVLMQTLSTARTSINRHAMRSDQRQSVCSPEAGVISRCVITGASSQPAIASMVPRAR